MASGKITLYLPGVPEVKTLSASDMSIDSGLSLNGTNKVYRFGTLCILLFDIKITNPSSHGALAITGYLPTGFRPHEQITVAGADGSSDGKIQTVTINSSGKMTIFPVALNATSYAQGTAVYYCG